MDSYGDDSYDVIVLGGGTAGTAAAREASRAGARVVMFNDGELGGLCILRGCMPTKTMLHAAEQAHLAAHAQVPGVTTRLVDVDFAAVMANKDAKVERFRRAKVDGIAAGGYEVVDARAAFRDPETVVAGGRTYRFRCGAVIATGSVPSAPDLPGLEATPWLSSDEVMRLTERPASMIVVGSGAVGLELAQFFARVGTRVTLVSRRRILEKFEPLLADEMEAAFRAEPDLELVQPVAPRAVSPTDGGVRMELADGSSVEAERLLLATGRAADLAGLGLEAAGVEVVGGHVVHGPDMRTSNPRVFVGGDATGERQLLHVANWEGSAAGWNALGREPTRRIDDRVPMEVFFTDPPVALVGRTEAQARAAGEEVLTAVARLPETGRAITMDVRHGAMKLVARRDTGRLLGAQLCGPRMDDIAHVVACLVHQGTTAEGMLALPWYHPTISEVLLSLGRDLAAGAGGAA